MLHLRRCLTALFLCLLPALLPAATPPATGALEGRVAHGVTGAYLVGVRVTVEGTTLETATDADGIYRLGGVAAGTARVRAFYTGLPPQTVTAQVPAGGTATADFRLAPAGAGDAGGPIQLDQFVVASEREMSGAALSINEQRFAPNIKNVVAVDEFGDVAEGNVAEFLKFLPGVNIDYAGGKPAMVTGT